jgi:hypothetical protein
MRRLRLMLAVPLGLALTGASAAPAFEVTDSAGVVHKLSDYRGKVVILEWMNPYCDANGKYYNDDKTVWLMINSYKPDQEGYTSANVARYLLMSTGAKVDGFVSDSSAELAKAYNVDQVPLAVIIDGNGNLAYRGSFDDHEGGDPAGLLEAPSHIDDVLTSLAKGETPAKSGSKPNGCPFTGKAP